MILTNEWLPKGASLIGQQSTEQRIFMMLSVVKSKVKSDCLESPNPNVMKISPLNSDHHHPYCDARIILLPIAALYAFYQMLFTGQTKIRRMASKFKASGF